MLFGGRACLACLLVHLQLNVAKHAHDCWCLSNACLTCCIATATSTTTQIVPTEAHRLPLCAMHERQSCTSDHAGQQAQPTLPAAAVLGHYILHLPFLPFQTLANASSRAC